MAAGREASEKHHTSEEEQWKWSFTTQRNTQTPPLSRTHADDLKSPGLFGSHSHARAHRNTLNSHTAHTHREQTHMPSQTLRSHQGCICFQPFLTMRVKHKALTLTRSSRLVDHFFSGRTEECDSPPHPAGVDFYPPHSFLLLGLPTV